MVKKLGLRKGDLVTGVIRTPREGERKEKFNPMVRIDTVNGADLDGIRQRPDFAKLTPLYPQSDSSSKRPRTRWPAGSSIWSPPSARASVR